jgi:uncharacterized protein with ParB-like and HNH nuclease domain
MKAWDIKKTQYKVSDFLHFQKSGTLVLSPSFQRRSVWRPAAKSYLIDTIIKGLPIPIIFIRDRKANLKKLESVREVVDGQQRLRTVISFVAPQYLTNYVPERDDFQILKAHNPEYQGYRFADLPEDIQQSILDYEFSVHVLPAQVGDREVLSIFARLNSTGLRLTAQELRNAEYLGEIKVSIYESAFRQLERWRAWKIFTEDNIARMEEVELVSEFYLLILYGVTGKADKTLNKLYADFDVNFPDRIEVERRFEHVMEEIDNLLGLAIAGTEYVKKTLFYILFAYVYDCTFGLKSGLKRAKPSPLSRSNVAAIERFSDSISSGNAPMTVLAAAARRTTHPKSRNTLLKYMKDMGKDGKGRK